MTTNEIETLRRIMVAVIESELRWRPPGPTTDGIWAYHIANDIVAELRRHGIQVVRETWPNASRE